MSSRNITQARSPRLPSGPKQPASTGADKTAATSHSPIPRPADDFESSLSGPFKAARSELIARIRNSAGFIKALKRRELFNFLYSNRHRLLSDKDVASEHFGIVLSEANVAVAANSARVKLGEVRDALHEFSKLDNSKELTCQLPEAQVDGGYHLVFKPFQVQLSAAQCFWAPHEQSLEKTKVITGSHLFFFDPNDEKIVRYYNFNSVAEEAGALREELRVANSAAVNVEALIPQHNAYFASGDIKVYEELLRFFHGQTQVLIERITSRDTPVSGLPSNWTPILIGRPKLNPCIEIEMNSDRGSEYRYRIHGTRGTIKIKDITEDERAALSAYPISADGVVGPTTDQGKVFGIVTRMPNSSGLGSITIVACDDYSHVISRLIEMLTKNDSAALLLNRMGWPLGRPLPKRFELLFVVQLAPGGLGGEAYPEFVRWRDLDG